MGSLDYWREYFRGADSGIFDAIENAILVAASDRPDELRRRRDRIAQLLFSAGGRCLGCDRVGSRVQSNCSYDEAEALTEELEEEGQTVGEVLRIKEVLSDGKYQSEGVLFESLRRLQLMTLTVDTLQTTEVGKAVNRLRRHRSKRISSLAQNLVDEWKALVHEWINSAAIPEEATPESADPATSSEMDNGLPFPPLDEGAFLTTQATSMELSEFFDGMDEDGNPRTVGEFDKIDGKGKTLENHNSRSQKPSRYLPDLSNDEDPIKKQDALRRSSEAINTNSNYQEVENRRVRQPEASNRMMETKDSMQKQPKANASAPDSGPGRNPKPCNNHQKLGDTKLQERSRSDVHKKPTTASHNKHSEENLNQAKLEIAKRKLHEGYQQAQNAKRQHTIQVMELNDLAKQPVSHKPPHMKLGNRTRKWANGCC